MAGAPQTLTTVGVTSGSPYRAILKLATPTVIAMLTQSIVNEIDIIFFKWLPDPESTYAQGALLPSLIILWLFGGTLSTISVGTQAISARRFAEHRNYDAGAVLVNSWFFGAVSSVLVTIATYAALPMMLEALIKVPEVRVAASEYLEWRLLGIASMVLTFSFKSFFDGIGKTHIHMVAAIVMNIVNVVLCLLLIFGNWGFPRMGIAGAGLAGFIATWIGLFFMIGYAVLPKYRHKFKPFQMGRLSRRITWDILRLSIPGAIANIAVMSGFLLFSFIVSYFDEHSGAAKVTNSLGEVKGVNSAATTVIVGILKLTFTGCLAFGTSTATLVSQSLAERKPDRASVFGWSSVKLGLLIFGIVGLLEGVVFTREVLSIFADPAVLDAAMMPMRIMGICTPLIAVGMILTQALFGAGATRYVMVVELILHFTCLVPLAWILGITLNFGLVGIWSAAVVYVIGLTIAMVVKFAGGSWKKIEI